MPQLALACPHCLTEKVGFNPFAVSQVRPNEARTLLVVQCTACGEGMIIEVSGPASEVSSWVSAATPPLKPFNKMYPQAEQSKCPDDVPEIVAKAYLSGVENLRSQLGANAAGIMFRRAIEVALKLVNPTGDHSKSMQKRIDALPDDIATPAMKKWAHKIRLEGNGAAHDVDELTQKDAENLRIFTEMFLMYAFTLPEMVRKSGGDEKTHVR